MAIRDILLFQPGAANEVLTTAGEDVPEVDDAVRALLDDLADTMYSSDGVGLAANQIGDLRRVCVIDPTSEEDRAEGRDGLIELVNPRVVHSDGRIVWEEGCLSFPELFEKVTRPGHVTVEALNRHGEPFTVAGEELMAVVLQHEIDHLDGVLFIDYLSRLKRSMALKRYRRVLQALLDESTESTEPG